MTRGAATPSPTHPLTHSLCCVLQDHPKYAAEHQMVVMDCLESTDETLRRKVRAPHQAQ